jgi:hypothetical protein
MLELRRRENEEPLSEAGASGCGMRWASNSDHHMNNHVWSHLEKEAVTVMPFRRVRVRDGRVSVNNSGGRDQVVAPEQ